MSEEEDYLSGLGTPELLGVYAAVLRELSTRSVVRTKNAPAGDYAEYLTAVAYSGKLAAPSEKSWDVAAADGRKLQVKSRVIDSVKQDKRIQFSAFRSWAFEAGVLVVLDSRDYSILWAVEAPSLELRTLANHQEWVRADIVTRSRTEILDLPHAVDVTVRYKNAIAQLNCRPKDRLFQPLLRDDAPNGVPPVARAEAKK